MERMPAEPIHRVSKLDEAKLMGRMEAEREKQEQIATSPLVTGFYVRVLNPTVVRMEKAITAGWEIGGINNR